MEQDFQKKRIEANQKFLLGLLNLNLFGFYPLRKWLGIDYKGRIDEVSHLSIAYDTKYFKKGKKWFKQQTRVYQQPDLGYKLNLILERIPEVIIPKVGQPSWGLLQMRLLSNTTTTYQPTIKDTKVNSDYPTTNYGSETPLSIYGSDPSIRSFLDFDASDIPDAATFTQGNVSIHLSASPGLSKNDAAMVRMTRTDWTELGATWNKYDGTNAWTTAGGDYTTTNKQHLIIGQTVTWYTFSSSVLISDCWNNQAKHINVGLIEDPINYSCGVNFHSREYTTDIALRPKLTVTYTVPVKDNSIFFSCNF